MGLTLVGGGSRHVGTEKQSVGQQSLEIAFISHY
jgi:hypothetical protein